MRAKVKVKVKVKVNVRGSKTKTKTKTKTRTMTTTRDRTRTSGRTATAQPNLLASLPPLGLEKSTTAPTRRQGRQETEIRSGPGKIWGLVWCGEQAREDESGNERRRRSRSASEGPTAYIDVSVFCWAEEGEQRTGF